MHQINLGNSSLRVSSISLGTMYFGSKTSQTDSFSLLDRYLDIGGNFIDTANNYAFWMENSVGDESETLIGKWMKNRQNRDKVVLATKVGARPEYIGAGIDKMEGLSYQRIMEAVEESLRRLQTDYIDLYYAHVDWYDAPLEERLKAFEKLVQDGKVREIGASNMYPWRFERSQQISNENQWPSYCCVQQKYSYLRPKYNADFWVQKQINEEWLDYSHHNEVTLVAYSPLLSGGYARLSLPEEYQTRDNEIRLSNLRQISEEMDITINQLVLAWIMNHPTPIIPVIAASSTDQLLENMDAHHIQLDHDIMRRLNASGD